MNGPFAVLGVGVDADDRAIKLAYAKLLRRTRPDDDPEGFQRLNEAYQHALRIAQARKTLPASSSPISASPPGENSAGLQRLDEAHQHAPRIVLAQKSELSAASSPPISPTLKLAPTTTPRVTPRPPSGKQASPTLSEPPSIPSRPASEPAAPHAQQSAFDLQSFITEYRTISSAGDARVLARWLMDYPALWHLPTKQAAGQWLLRALFEAPEAMPDACFRATVEFFHFDDALGGIDPMALRRVATRIEAARLVEPRNQSTLAYLSFGNTLVRSRRDTAAAIKRLSRPFRWWRDLPQTLRPPYVHKVAKVANALCGGNLDDLPPVLDRSQGRFWMEACNPAKSRVRLLLALFRCMVALALAPLVFATMAGIFQHLLLAPDPLKSALDAWEAMFATVGFVVVLYWIPIGAHAVFKGADALAHRSRTFRLLMLSVTPAMCGVAMLVTWAMDATLGVLVAIATMFVAIWRLRAVHRMRKPKQAERISLVFLCFAYLAVFITLCAAGASFINPLLLPTLAIVMIALVVWAYDWFKRGFLRPRMQQAQD